MHGILSNALSALAQTTGPPPQTDLGPLMVPMAAGVLLGIVWLARRIAYPKKFVLVGTPARSNRLHPIIPVGLFVLLMTFSAGSNWLWAAWFGGHRKFVLKIITAHTVFLVVCIAVAIKTFRHGLSRGCGLTLHHWRYDLVRGVVSMLIALPVCIGLKLTTDRLVRWIFSSQPDRIEDLIRPHGLFEALSTLPVEWQVMAVISAVVVAPLSEEVFFRGIVQSSVRQITGRPWIAIVVASIFFAVTHGEWVNRPALFALGLVLGYNYERTGRLMPAMLIHSLFNATFIAAHLSQPA